VVLLTGDKSIAAFHELKKQTKILPSIEFIDNQKPVLAEIAKFYAPFRHNLLTSHYQKNLANKELITQMINTQLVQLSNPFVSETLAYDPRLNLADYLNQSFSQLGNFEYTQGIANVLYEDKRYFIARLQLAVDGFSLKKGQLLAEQLQSIFAELTDQYAVELFYSGVVFHTSAASEQAEFEISVFGGFSLFSVILLVLFVFRSVMPLVTASLVIAIASFYGFTAILLLFKDIHLLTLVFAVTLIGIVIDYCFHVFIALEKKQIRNIRTPLILGFITTVLGYSALMLSPLELLTQVAVFMVFGLFGALLTVLMVLPKMSKLIQLTISPLALKISLRIQHSLKYLANYQKAIFVSLLLSIITLLMYQPLTFNDDVRLLNSSPKNLLAHEKVVSKVVGYQRSQRIIIKANSIQLLLERQEKVIQQLSSAQTGLVFKGLFNLLPSIKLQQLNFKQLKKADDLGIFKQGLAITDLQDYITEFSPLTFDAFIKNRALKLLADTYIADYEVGSLDSKTQLFGEKSELKHELSHEYVLWFEVNGKLLNEDNRQWLDKQAKVKLFNKAADVSIVLAEYRNGILTLLMIAFAVVGTVLMLRYGVKTGLVGLFATSISAIGALLLTQWFNGYLNIFNLLGVLLILALAIDYVIFYIEHGIKSQTVLAITLSALSSALVFGVLGMSVTPAVYSFGITVMFGIVLIFLLAPLAWDKNRSQ